MAASDTLFVAEAAAVDAVDAWASLRAEGRMPWLLCSAGAHPEARQSIVAFDPVAELEVRGHEAVVRELQGGTWRDVDRGAALPMMQAFCDRVPRLGAPGEGFLGGLVGWVGFEAARLWYPDLPEPRPRSAPDVLWRIYSGACTIGRQLGEGSTLRVTHLASQEACDDAAAALGRPATDAGSDPPERPDGPWRASLDEASFGQEVERMRALIGQGDVYQVNLAARFEKGGPVDAKGMFVALREANPSPYMALIEAHGHTLVSGSPELLFEVRAGTIAARPIAGTRRRDLDPVEDAKNAAELVSDAKEQAEHTMLVDLVRNDLARVSRPGTVRVTEAMSVERYRHVMHLASRVEGDVRDGTGLLDWLEALFPGGTVTGAPKERATRRILESEPVARGPYTGSVGYLSVTGDACFNILIRTLVSDGVTHSVHAGSGIVADSDPHREWREAQRKADALLQAASGHVAGGSLRGLGAVERRGAWDPPVGTAPAGRRVLLVDHEDSFVHNLADYCRALGAEVHVADHRLLTDSRLDELAPTHVILGPGPGRPEDSQTCMRLARLLPGRLPVLGVCLGHQALAAASGARVEVGLPVHGKRSDVHHDAGGLHEGLPDPFPVIRYHSLRVDPTTLAPGWKVDAWLADGTVMGLRHEEHAAFGVQFHPESMGTPHGMALLARFLETAPAMTRP